MKKLGRNSRISKHLGIMAFCLSLAFCLSCCGQDGSKKGNVTSSPGVKEVVQSQKDKEDAAKGKEASTDMGEMDGDSQSKGTSSAEPSSESAQESKTDPVREEKTPTESLSADVDLTVMSATMVYSEVYNMMYTPEDYVGKVIKIQGQYAVSEAGGNRYDLCVIRDATACCAQGMEFLLSDAYAYPEDYPEVGDEITVIGTFETYMEGEYMYCTLKDAQLF